MNVTVPKTSESRNKNGHKATPCFPISRAHTVEKKGFNSWLFFFSSLFLAQFWINSLKSVVD